MMENLRTVELIVNDNGPLGMNLQSCKDNRGAYIDSFYRGTNNTLLLAERSTQLQVGWIIYSINSEKVYSKPIKNISHMIFSMKRPLQLSFIPSEQHSLEFSFIRKNRLILMWAYHYLLSDFELQDSTMILSHFELIQYCDLFIESHQRMKINPFSLIMIKHATILIQSGRIIWGKYLNSNEEYLDLESVQSIQSSLIEFVSINFYKKWIQNISYQRMKGWLGLGKSFYYISILDILQYPLLATFFYAFLLNYDSCPMNHNLMKILRGIITGTYTIDDKMLTFDWKTIFTELFENHLLNDFYSSKFYGFLNEEIILLHTSSSPSTTSAISTITSPMHQIDIIQNPTKTLCSDQWTIDTICIQYDIVAKLFRHFEFPKQISKHFISNHLTKEVSPTKLNDLSLANLISFSYESSSNGNQSLQFKGELKRHSTIQKISSFKSHDMMITDAIQSDLFNNLDDDSHHLQFFLPNEMNSILLSQISSERFRMINQVSPFCKELTSSDVNHFIHQGSIYHFCIPPSKDRPMLFGCSLIKYLESEVTPPLKKRSQVPPIIVRSSLSARKSYESEQNVNKKEDSHELELIGNVFQAICKYRPVIGNKKLDTKQDYQSLEDEYILNIVNELFQSNRPIKSFRQHRNHYQSHNEAPHSPSVLIERHNSFPKKQLPVISNSYDLRRRAVRSMNSVTGTSGDSTILGLPNAMKFLEPNFRGAIYDSHSEYTPSSADSNSSSATTISNHPTRKSKKAANSTGHEISSATIPEKLLRNVGVVISNVFLNTPISDSVKLSAKLEGPELLNRPGIAYDKRISFAGHQNHDGVIHSSNVQTRKIGDINNFSLSMSTKTPEENPKKNPETYSKSIQLRAYGLTILTAFPAVHSLRYILSSIADEFNDKNATSLAGVISTNGSGKLLVEKYSNSVNKSGLDIDHNWSLERFKKRNIAILALSFLLEYKIILMTYSSNTLDLMSFSIWIRSALQPLHLSHIFAPVVPHSIGMDLLQCPSPYLVGLQKDLMDDDSVINEQFESNGHTVIFDLDFDTILAPSSLLEYCNESCFLFRNILHAVNDSIQHLNHKGERESYAMSTAKLCSQLMSDLLFGVKECGLLMKEVGAATNVLLFDEEQFISTVLKRFHSEEDSSLDEDPRALLITLICTESFTAYLHSIFH